MNFRVLRTIVSLALAASFYSGATAADGQRSSAQATATSSTKGDYILRPQDEIRVQVLREEDINKQGDGISISQECTITLPLIGTISLISRGEPLFVYGLFEIPSPITALARADQRSVKEVHETLSNALLILAGLHAAAGLLHHWVLRDRVLKRMWPFGG